MTTATADLVYPERRFGGFTRIDGTVQFCTRVQAMLQPGDVVLDVGCGRGRRQDDPCLFRRQLQDLRGSQRRVIGIDVDPLASRNPYLSEFRQIDQVDHWPVADESVDFIYCDYVLEHVEHPASFFSEVQRSLRPDGQLALRTPNALSYIALISRLIPNRFHARVLAAAQTDRAAEDVFPTVYRCNTIPRIRRTLHANGLDGIVQTVESEPCYLDFSDLAFRIGSVAHRWLPAWFRTTLLVFARKPRGH